MKDIKTKASNPKNIKQKNKKENLKSKQKHKDIHDKWKVQLPEGKNKQRKQKRLKRPHHRIKKARQLKQKVQSVQHLQQEKDTDRYAEKAVISQGKKTIYDSAYYAKRLSKICADKRKEMKKQRNIPVTVHNETKGNKAQSNRATRSNSLSSISEQDVKPVSKKRKSPVKTKSVDQRRQTKIQSYYHKRIEQKRTHQSVRGKTVKQKNKHLNTMKTHRKKPYTYREIVHQKRMKKKLLKSKQKIAKQNKLTHKGARGIKTALSMAVKGIRKTVLSIQNLICIGSATVFLIVLILFIGIFSALSDDTAPETSSEALSKEVIEYRVTIEKYAKQYDMKEYINLIQAVMMQESNGKGNDPMQSSESPHNKKYPQVPNGITSPEYSIEVGIQYLSECMKKAKVRDTSDMENISLALQGYNYGNGYIDWAINNFGKYTKANAKVFSDEMKYKLKTDVYGDPEYVEHVLRYYHIGDGEFVQIALSQVGNVGGKPYWSWYGYPNRVEWCACFVSWVANEAGLIDQGLVPKFANCVAGIQWFKQHNKWENKSIIPASGNIIFFDFNQDRISDHVGIVEYVEGDVIHTIEGNSIGDECRQRTYQVDSIYIVGYGVY